MKLPSVSVAVCKLLLVFLSIGKGSNFPFAVHVTESQCDSLRPLSSFMTSLDEVAWCLWQNQLNKNFSLPLRRLLRTLTSFFFSSNKMPKVSWNFLNNPDENKQNNCNNKQAKIFANEINRKKSERRSVFAVFVFGLVCHCTRRMLEEVVKNSLRRKARDVSGAHRTYLQFH